ncbi:flagellar basal body protein FliL [Pseudooceanicola sediminis]|uniref:Flagellar protein FliL n=1 Tax=Pseudooceanicola sediminis TaxID=2211117 RepID=A0A399JC47_9RHOB|nr:flagellar basal body-associated FliL family protein [Pseudooceanicola sediminis]KAA2315583.1 flagellar basal body protein FliL [Puniceibacterium sp. HSS470]RII40216.1 flagellar basal body protein FliL [Pseudooceanicola sediminis]|tara:strand:+ start:3361 stop:3855 length:495 start_codon:yes stop_codon:yes gene_type:complete
MSEETTDTEEEPKKRSKLPLILGVVLALVGGGGSFFAIYSGMILGGDDAQAEAAAETPTEVFVAPDVAFVALEPMVISFGPASENRHLRFTASLEVPSGQQGAVETVRPRVMDVLNNYLRALRMADFEDPAALVRIRAQMLRRIQVITGPDAVRDLLIVEFVMS